MRKFRLHDGQHGAALTIRVTPRARKTQIGGVLEDGTLRIRIQEPPVEGKANQALVKYLAKLLGVRKSRIEIVAGQTGLDKIVSVVDMNADQVQKKLEAAIEAEE